MHSKKKIKQGPNSHFLTITPTLIYKCSLKLSLYLLLINNNSYPLIVTLLPWPEKYSESEQFPFLRTTWFLDNLKGSVDCTDLVFLVRSEGSPECQFLMSDCVSNRSEVSERDDWQKHSPWSTLGFSRMVVRSFVSCWFSRLTRSKY